MPVHIPTLAAESFFATHMNHHLNLYKPYYQADDQADPIENNLTRALIIAMQQQSLLFYKVIELICDRAEPGADDFARQLFSEFRDPNDMTFEIQVNMRDLQEDVFEGGVFAVSLTTVLVDMEAFQGLTFGSSVDTSRITDILITIRDTLFVIEVKRTSIDCRQQLFDQVYPLKEKGNGIRGCSITWTDILSLLYTIDSLQKVAYEKNVFTQDLIQLLETHFPGIIPALPFGSFPFTFDRTTAEWGKMKQRLAKCLNGIEEVGTYQIRHYPDRSPVQLEWGWAREVSFWFTEDPADGAALFAYIWPANTKGQGWPVYTRSLNWLQQTSLQVGDQRFELQILYEVKFCHFNRYVSAFQFGDDRLRPGKLLHTLENFKKSGKYYREATNGASWADLDHWLRPHFVEDYDWKAQCNWEDNFVLTNRNNVSVSLGFQVRCTIPYSYLQRIDKIDADYQKVSRLFQSVVDCFSGLLDPGI